MKKYLSAVLALAIILTLFAGCGGAPAAEPDPEPASEPTSDAAEPAPEPEPSTLEGVVKEVSPDKLIITLADGSNVALTTSGIAGLEAEPGDTVRAEYTGAVGAMTASKVEVTAKAEKEIVTVSGVVTGLDDEFVYLTLEDGTDAALRTVSMEEGEVEEGDTLTIHYTDGGGTILSIDVTKAEKEPGTGVPAAAPDTTQTAPAASSQAPVSQAPTSQVPAPGSQVISGNADFYYFAVAASVNGDSVTFKKQDGTRTTIRYAEAFAVNMSDRKFQVGDDVVLGYRGTRDQAQLMYIMLNTAKQPGTVVSLDDDDDYYYDDDDDSNNNNSTASTNSTNKDIGKGNGKLYLWNKIIGTSSDRNKSFTFTVTLDDTSINGTYGNMTFKNGVTSITLKDNETVMITGLSGGTSYSVTEAEANQNGFFTFSTGETGTVDESGTSTMVRFTNMNTSYQQPEVYEAIDLINKEREKEGLPELTVDLELIRLAAVRAQEMIFRYDVDHIRPDGRECWTVFEDYGSSLSPRAENGGKSANASAQIAAWMNSKPHRENILDSVATKIGVGYSGNAWAMVLAK